MEQVVCINDKNFLLQSINIHIHVVCCWRSETERVWLDVIIYLPVYGSFNARTYLSFAIIASTANWNSENHFTFATTCCDIF